MLSHDETTKEHLLEGYHFHCTVYGDQTQENLEFQIKKPPPEDQGAVDPAQTRLRHTDRSVQIGQPDSGRGIRLYVLGHRTEKATLLVVKIDRCGGLKTTQILDI